jgi:type II secretory pathway component GspD/PulD (secretin)
MSTPLDQALTLLVAPTGFNVIVGDGFGDKVVSLSFQKGTTDLRSALDMMTRANGLDYVVQAGTIVIGTKETLYGGLIDFETRVFVLNYAEPRSVKQMLLQTGLVEQNQVEIYSERPTGAGGAGQAGGGAAGAGGGAAATGGDSGGSGMSMGIGSGPASLGNVSTTPQNAIMIKAIPEQMSRIAAIISSIDRKPLQVELEVRVCEANENALKDLGLEVNRVASSTDPDGFSNATGQVWNEQPRTLPSTGTLGFEAFSLGGFRRLGLSFTAELFHQLQQGNVRVLAQPTLTTSEGKEAVYFAGDRVPYISQPANNTGASSQAAQVDFIDLGVKLKFTPRIDSDGKVTIDVRPEVSSLVRFIDLGSGAVAPQSTQRELQTTVRVDNCEPFVLAGLISENERETMNRIPILSDLPMVGKLFRHTTKDRNRTEIIIIVVPKIRD